MELWHSIVLGLVQGLTEFLPISSSGHLVVAQSLMKVPASVVVPFDIVVHLGTLIAVTAYFRDELISLYRGLRKREMGALRLTLLLVIGTIPAIILGFLAKDYFERLFGDPAATGWQLLVNGLILIGADYLSGRRRIEDLNQGDAVLIGIGQALAIIPGISRSGSTMAVGLARKMSRQAAAKFSFLLAIPIILGAGLLNLKDLFSGGYQAIGVGPFWLGFLTSLISSYLVIKLFLDFLAKGTLKFFGYYSMFLGALVVVWFSR